MPRQIINRTTVGTTAARQLTANGDRLAYAVGNISTGVIAVGPDNSVTVATGARVEANRDYAVDDDTGEVWVIGDGAGLAIQVIELVR